MILAASTAFGQTSVTETQTVTPAPVVPVAPANPPLVEQNTTTTTTTERPLTHEEKERAKKQMKREAKAEKERIEHPDRAARKDAGD